MTNCREDTGTLWLKSWLKIWHSLWQCIMSQRQVLGLLQKFQQILGLLWWMGFSLWNKALIDEKLGGPKGNHVSLGHFEGKSWLWVFLKNWLLRGNDSTAEQVCLQNRCLSGLLNWKYCVSLALYHSQCLKDNFCRKTQGPMNIFTYIHLCSF